MPKVKRKKNKIPGWIWEYSDGKVDLSTLMPFRKTMPTRLQFTDDDGACHCVNGKWIEVEIMRKCRN